MPKNMLWSAPGDIPRTDSMRGLRSRSRLSRTYVGSTDRLTFSQDVRIAGEFHAANSALVDWSAHNEIYGAVFAGNFKWSQQTLIHYDRGVFRAGDACPRPAEAAPVVAVAAARAPTAATKPASTARAAPVERAPTAARRSSV